MNNKKTGNRLIVLGVLLLLAAAALTEYNFYLQKRAGEDSQEMLEEFLSAVSEQKEKTASTKTAAAAVGDTNPVDETAGGAQYAEVSDSNLSPYAATPDPFRPDGENASSGVLSMPGASSGALSTPGASSGALSTPGASSGALSTPRASSGTLSTPRVSSGSLDALADSQTEDSVYTQTEDIEMPIIEIRGRDCIGIVSIPSIGITLPVQSEWSLDNLKYAPCRYTGSVYKDDMILCAHNFDSHFGRLKTLQCGDCVQFYDADGNVFRYSVVEIETILPYDNEEMRSGDWDLTLFTCTIGGRSRVTVRCAAE